MFRRAHKKDTAQIKTSFRQKLFLIALGLILFLVVLESGLRAGGFALSSLQECKNWISASHKGTYRIMCLGESTTAGEYPPLLEQILNESQTGIKFSVIDKGIAGADTAKILAQLESDLDEYRPHMVVAMMGINDSGMHVPYETVSRGPLKRFVSSLRTYKLVRLLWLHILAQRKESPPPRGDGDVWVSGLKPQGKTKYLKRGKSYFYQGKFPQAEAYLEKASESNPRSDRGCLLLGRIYLEQYKFSQLEDYLKKLIQLNPGSEKGYYGLGKLYFNQGKFPQAEECLKKAAALNPQREWGYLRLGKFYLNQQKFPQAEEYIQKATDSNPHSDWAYIEWGWFYLKQNQFPQAEECLKKAFALNPRNDRACFELGWFYRNQNKLFLAEETFKKAIALNPSNDRTYFELGCLYRDQNKLLLAEKAFKKAIKLNPQSDRTCAAIAKLYQGMGKPGPAKAYERWAESLRLGYYNPITVGSFQRLKEILDKRNIKLACVQYPMRSLKPLKKIFQGDERGIIFVDNEMIFKEAVKTAGHREYFQDMFGGDLGHCTQKGNKLLAENIARVLIKEVFNK